MRNTFLFFLALLFISSCNSDPDLTKIVPDEIDSFARKFINNLHSGNIDFCLQNVDKEMQTEEGKTFLSNVANGINPLKLDSIKLSTARFTKFYGDVPVVNYSIEYEQELNDYSVFFIFGIRVEGNNISVTGFDARRVEASLKETHSFSLTNKPLRNYIFLILAIISVGFVLFTFVVAIRTPMKNKWLWAIGILFTLIKFKLNWTTSEIEFQLLSIQFIGAGFSKTGLFTPWIISTSIPVFAISFWIKKIRLRNELAEEEKFAAIMAKYKKTDESTGA